MIDLTHLPIDKVYLAERPKTPNCPISNILGAQKIRTQYNTIQYPDSLQPSRKWEIIWKNPDSLKSDSCETVRNMENDMEKSG